MAREEELKKFLVYSYFKIDVEASNEKEILKEKCISRAYLDVCRTIKYKKCDDCVEKKKDYEKKKNNYVDKVNGLIYKQIAGLEKHDGFDSWHEETCNTIIKVEDNVLESALTYGQAQKWLNMTMKYMWLLGLMDEHTSSFLHVPVDKNIMKIASNNGILLKRRDNKDGAYNEEKSLPWSQWESKEYKNFQSELKEMIGIGTLPIVWENDVWINLQS